MFDIVYNIIALLLTVFLSVFSYLNGLNNLKYLLILLGVYILVYIIVSAVKKEKLTKLLIYPLVGALTLFGVFNLTKMFCSTVKSQVILNETKSYAEAIMNKASTYKEVFENDDYYFYVDRNFETMSQISKTDTSDMVMYPIQNAKNLNKEMDIFSPFFNIELMKGTTKTSNYDIHFAMMKNVQESSILVRFVADKDTYYSYIEPKDIKAWAASIDFIEPITTEGYTDFYITKNSVTADLKDVTESTEIKIAENAPGLITVTNKYYFYSDATYVDYKKDTDYVTRVNNYFNKDLLDKIQNLPDTEDKEEQSNELMSKVQTSYVELINETLGDKQSFRYYRVYNPDIHQQMIEQNPDASMDVDLDIVSVFEWDVGDSYFIGRTNIPTNQLFNFTLE